MLVLGGILSLVVVLIFLFLWWTSRAYQKPQEKSMEELKADRRIKEIEILGSQKLRATYQDGKVIIYQRKFD